MSIPTLSSDAGVVALVAAAPAYAPTRDALRAAYGFRTVGLRYFNVFGPRQDPHGAYAAVIPAWVELFEAVRDALADALPDRPDLRHAAPVHGPPRAGDVRHSRADVGLAERVLGYRAVVGVREGIERTLLWFVAAAEREVE